MDSIVNKYGVLKHKPTEKVGDEIYRLTKEHFQKLLSEGHHPADVRIATEHFTANCSIAASEVLLEHSCKLRTQELKILKKPNDPT